VHPKDRSLILAVILLCSGCSVNLNNEKRSFSSDFVTATLPVTLTQAPTSTSIPPSPAATQPPVEGTTTTQLNVRSEPSTIGSSLGIIAQFEKVQILGKESNGAWYQIAYDGAPQGKGWVTAAYVEVDGSAQIPVVQTGTGSGLGLSGLAIQPVNIRSGPGTNYESLGTLAPNDVVRVTGSDSSGTWLQIEFKGGAGWATSEFLKVDNADTLPVTIQPTPTGPAEASTETANPPVLISAVPDGDSMQNPLAAVILSGTGVKKIQFSGSISAPDGDVEDWVQISAANEFILIDVECSGDELDLEIWDEDKILSEHEVVCTNEFRFVTQIEEVLYLHVQNNQNNGAYYSSYTLKAGIIQP